jgi:predicted nucleic acid-binding protein
VRELFLLDASVLIDLSVTAPSVLAAISTHVGTLHVASTMLTEEIPELSVDDCEELGVRVVEPELEILRSATERMPGLSFHDRVCLLLAERNTWTCLTNDARLRRECKRRAVAHQWGLEPVVALVAGHHLDRGSAKKLIGALQERSPGHYGDQVVALFLASIGS